ncbi:4'-phosphopantetheinyl transferase [Diaminobutyricimonas aerilata]|uniref:4'-phosphopantetheinyl transferase n=1 Tax=Diaminobutyricimonas aerilata TaxID=1162967 RepID=A0A2M9CNF2_9MICO|nr:4-phosphopantetheinyl transferase [Diaminobutyricimonas aerilata]PJJ73431.1 4'-phosphopantetheinyl transferase [Diaminobutyricimonas aerilata]
MLLVRRVVGGTPGAGAADARALAATVLGVPEDDLVVSAVCPDCGGPHGRPSLRSRSGAAVGAWVSVTHAGTGTWVAVTDEGDVGVDAELAAQPAERIASIAALVGVDAMDVRQLLRRWTRIEAVLKADGRGLRVDPARVLVSDDGSFATLGDTRIRYRFVEVEQPVDAVLSVAVREPAQPEPAAV